eukprot:10239512-Prorocentrum_lima.AAC.1
MSAGGMDPTAPGGSRDSASAADEAAHPQVSTQPAASVGPAATSAAAAAPTPVFPHPLPPPY